VLLGAADRRKLDHCAPFLNTDTISGGIFGGITVATVGRMPTLVHAELTRAIIGAFYKVYNELGHGYSERIYRRALTIVLRELGLLAIEECRIKVIFHGILIGTFWADIVVDRKILIEIKGAKELEARDEAQILNYLTAAGGGIGLLVNFGRTLTHKRFVMGNPEANLPNVLTIDEMPDELDVEI